MKLFERRTVGNVENSCPDVLNEVNMLKLDRFKLVEICGMSGAAE